MGSEFLFAQPSWLSGLARTLDVAGQFDSYNDSPTGTIADQKAWLNDWRDIGRSFVEAVMGLTSDQAQETTDHESAR